MTTTTKTAAAKLALAFNMEISDGISDASKAIADEALAQAKAEGLDYDALIVAATGLVD